MGSKVLLGDVIRLDDSRRQPLSSRQREDRKGCYPYYGAQGIVDYLDDYTYDGTYLLVAEDGENLRSRKLPLANLVTGKFRVNNHAHVLAGTEKCDIHILGWLLNSMNISAYVTGSTQPKLSQKNLLSIELDLPSVDEQRAIMALLGSIDRKTALNQQTNDYLEQACQALFDEFDSDEANPFVAVSDVADVNPKRMIKKGEEALCVEMSDLSTSGSFPSGWRMKPYNGGMKFVNGDTVMARITPCLENGKTGYINFLDDNQTAFGSTEYIVLATKGDLPPEYFYFLARNREFVAYAVAHMNGSSGRQRVSGADIERYEVRMPNAEQLERFRRVAGSAMKMILANSLENRQLAELRDALLPRLMSGEIDVSQIKLPKQPNNHLSAD